MLWAGQKEGCFMSKAPALRRAVRRSEACSAWRYGAQGRACCTPRARRRADSAPAGAPLRQPEVRSGSSCTMDQARNSRSRGCFAAPACRSRSPARPTPGARCAMRRAPPAGSGRRPLSRRRTALVLPDRRRRSRASRRQCHCATATAPGIHHRQRRGRRAGQHHRLQRSLVPGLGRDVSRLCRAEQAVGHAAGRGDQVAGAACAMLPTLLGDQPHHHVDVGDLKI